MSMEKNRSSIFSGSKLKCEFAFLDLQTQTDILGVNKIIRPNVSSTLLSKVLKSSLQCAFSQSDLLPLSELSTLVLAYHVFNL